MVPPQFENKHSHSDACFVCTSLYFPSSRFSGLTRGTNFWAKTRADFSKAVSFCGPSDLLYDKSVFVFLRP